MVLDRIKKVNDIKQLNEEELAELQEEIRDFLVENIAKTGGHLASNLGVIELTMALHLSFDLTRDRIIWDVGHQSYTHKILTGRKLGFATLRRKDAASEWKKDKDRFFDFCRSLGKTCRRLSDCCRYSGIPETFQTQIYLCRWSVKLY